MKKYTFLYFLMLILFSSCEEVIEMDVKQGKEAIVVEGWITDRASGNFVKLYKTLPYFDKPEYTPVINAIVQVRDDAGNEETLTETEPGKYEIKTLTGQVGRSYKLIIEAAEGKYEANTKMHRVSWAVDSVTYEFKEKSKVIEDEGYRPKIYGQEMEGVGDFLRLKVFRNGAALTASNEINLFSDEFVDGNYIYSAQPMIKKPFQKGDKIRYEMWSLTEDAYHFWSDVRTQLNNGGLFAEPGNNTRTNVIKKAPTSMEVVGYFGASEITIFESTVK